MTDSILTVTTAAASRDLTTLRRIKAELGIVDRKSDSLLRPWIREASGLIETKTNRVFAQETVSEMFRLRRHQRRDAIKLARYPVTTIASVTDIDGTVLAATSYEADLSTGMIWRLSGDASPNDRRIWWDSGKITVAYTAGYVLMDSLPFPLEQACLTLLKHRWAAKDRDPMVTSEEVAGIERSTFWIGAVGEDGALPPEVESLIASFRDVRV